jgi:hypothetical protein
MELDGYSQDLKIAFEYQGRQHYETMYFLVDQDLKRIQKNDRLKAKICKDRGVSLFIFTHEQNYRKFPQIAFEQAQKFGLPVDQYDFKQEIDFDRAYIRTDKLEELREPIQECLANVFSYMEMLSVKILEVTFQRFPKVIDDMNDFVTKFLNDEKDKAKYIVDSIVDMEISYLFTNDNDYLIQYTTFIPKNQEKKNEVISLIPLETRTIILSVSYPSPNGIITINSDEIDNLFKVGRAKNIKTRLFSYQTGKAHNVELLYLLSVHHMKDAEKCIKSQLKEFQYRTRREIYQVPLNMLKKFRIIYDKRSTNFRKQVNNITWLFFEQFIGLGLGLVVGIWVARYLGPGQYGQYNYALSLVFLFLPLVQLGLDGIVVRELVIEKNPNSRDEILGTSFFIRITSVIAIRPL